MDQLGKIVRYDSDDEEEVEHLETLLEERRLTGTKARPLIEELPAGTSTKTTTTREKTLESHCRDLSRSSERFEKAAQSIERTMKTMKTVVDRMLEVSTNNLDIERTRLRILEVNKTSKRVEEHMIEEGDPNKSENNNQLSLSIQKVKRVIEDEINSPKINIKRDYKLTQRSNIDIWLDYLKSELMSNELLDVIDTKVSGPDNILEVKAIKRKSLVRDIIINHLDECYHKRILNLTDPKEILEKVKFFKTAELNVTHTSVRAKLHQIKMKCGEKVDVFCERFESIIREYDMC